VRRTAVLALLAALAVPLIIAACVEHPTAPVSEPITVGPSFSFTGGSGTVLGSTNRGELVEIDLDSGTVTRIGDAGIFAGDSVGWTDIAFDGSGTLFGLSRISSESDFEVHLYTINPSTGAIISDIGSAGDHAFSDFDHDGSDFYGSGAEDGPTGCCGQLFTIDVTNAQATWISSDTLGFGLNPYDTVGLSPVIAKGGFAVHPVTGDFWGIEALQSSQPVLYRIDRTSGEADSILRLGLGGAPAPTQFGFDALHIQGDGTFLAARGGANMPADSVIWEITSTPDPSSGLAEIAVIPLTVDTLIVGNINGLEAGSAQGSPTLTLTADTTELHPWIQVPPKTGDTTTVVLSALSGQQAAEGLTVELRAEFLPSGGHAHITAPLDFEDAPTHAYGGTNPQQQAVTGYFKQGDNRTKSLTDVTDSNGQVTFAFVAGWVGGEVDLIATTEVGGQSTTDTLRVVIKVPDLTSLHTDQEALANALFVGGTAYHPQFINWHVIDAFGEMMTLFAQAMHVLDGSRYVQLNDASLPYGGAFSEVPPEGPTSVRVDAPFRPHNSHAIGVDMDVALCWASVSGATAGQTGRVSPAKDDGPPVVYTCPGSSRILPDDLEMFANGYDLDVIREDNHYHLRYVGN
jgi:hypothetical protein